MKLKFLGGAGTVTGSKYLLETNDGTRVLIDCGLFQGSKDLRLLNRDKFPVDPKSIDAVVLTHAHIDHSGYIPALVKLGYRGPIHATSATVDQCRILLPDSGRLQEEEAEYANRKGFSKHHPALPIYTQAEAEQSLEHFVSHPYEKWISVNPKLRFQFENSGHILGSAVVRIEADGKSLVFTGDLGRKNDAIFRPAATVAHADYLVIESTYGNRIHDDSDPEQQLGALIREVAERDGVILVPAFSVGRSQLLLYYLSHLKEKGLIPDIPVFLNSPMSINATGIFCDHLGTHKLTESECVKLCDVATYVRTAEESKRLNARSGPMIIISANGMATGGRILHHLKAFAPHAQNLILFTGYQASGTRGAAMVQGSAKLKIHGTEVPVRARVSVLHNLSGHADSRELVEWMRGFSNPPKRTFVTHGEPDASEALSKKIRAELGWSVETPKLGFETDL